MKKLLLSILLLVLATASLLAQQHVDISKNINEKDQARYYLKKSRGQKAGATVLLTTGLVACTLGGLCIAYKDQGMFGPVGPEIAAQNLRDGIIVLGAGMAAITGSVILFNKAAKNKAKANLILSNQPLTLTPKFHLSQTSIGLSIPLGK